MQHRTARPDRQPPSIRDRKDPLIRPQTAVASVRISHISRQKHRHGDIPRTITPIDSRKHSPKASTPMRSQGLHRLSSRAMERKRFPKSLTFVSSGPPAFFLRFPPEKAHLLNTYQKKLMNSEGYPQAQRTSNRTHISRRGSPESEPRVFTTMQNPPIVIPKVLTLSDPHRHRRNFITFSFQAFAVSEHPLAPENPHLSR